MGIYTLGPILGPAVGSIAGGFIAEHMTWRWVFWSSSALVGAIQLLSLIWLQESYASVLLKSKRMKFVREKD
jgi:MFS family permease